MGEAAGQVTGWEARPGGEAPGDDSNDGVTGDPEVDQLVEEIEVTRVEMTTTVEEIGDRLDPKNIVAGARETVREATVGKVEAMVDNAGQTAQQAGSGLLETIKRNPVPAAMAGLGLGWLAMSARSQGSKSKYGNQAHYATGGYGYSPSGGQYGTQPGSWDTSSMGGPGIGQQVGDKLGQAGQAAGNAASSVQDTAGNVVGAVGQTAGNVAGTVGQTAGNVVGTVGQTAGDVVGNVQQTAGQVVDTVGEKAGQGAQQVQTVARDVGSNASRFFQESPLAIGAIAVAVGTAVGMALPATKAERNVLGQARDQVINKAEAKASDALSSAEQQAREQDQPAS